jgi:hypothetical protein
VNFQNVLESEEWLTNLALANAMKTPRPKRERDQSIDRAKLAKIYGENDRISIRDNFTNFVKELYFLINPQIKLGGGTENLLEIVSNDPQIMDDAQAFEHLMRMFADTVYKIIFCDWLSEFKDEALFETNFRRAVNVVSTTQQQQISFYVSLPTANGKTILMSMLFTINYYYYYYYVLNVLIFLQISIVFCETTFLKGTQN